MRRRNVYEPDYIIGGLGILSLAMNGLMGAMLPRKGKKKTHKPKPVVRQHKVSMLGGRRVR